MIDVPSRFHANPEGLTGCVVNAREADAGMALLFTSIMRTAHWSGSSHDRERPDPELHDRYASWRPSAENAGSRSIAGGCARVIGRGSPPPTGLKQTHAGTLGHTPEH